MNVAFHTNVIRTIWGLRSLQKEAKYVGVVSRAEAVAELVMVM